MGLWKSKYGRRFVSLPSIIKQSSLKFELMEIK